MPHSSEAPAIRVDRHVPIPMRDGARLSAALHWPPGVVRGPSATLGATAQAGSGPSTSSERARGEKYPVVIEYHPYRKDDRSAPRAVDHDYFARHGFVSVRLDVRGTGSSEGVNTDEYMPIETQDGYDAVEWFAKQPWCNGNVGMFGSSYGGFTCFQVASLAPPHLKAIAPMYVTDDRYTDDCHYKGGAFKAYYDVGTYGTMMVALNALPPDPEAWRGPSSVRPEPARPERSRRVEGRAGRTARGPSASLGATGQTGSGPVTPHPHLDPLPRGERGQMSGVAAKWEEAWRERIEKNEPYMRTWLAHQTDDDYWKPGSLRPGYGRIKAATFIIGGWQDGYPNPPGRSFANLRCPKRLLIGPWNHSRPDVAVPGPRIDYLHEIRRWFDLWLKGEDDGISKEPPVTAYVQSYDRPDHSRRDTSGEWRSWREWPPEEPDNRTLFLCNGINAADGALLDTPPGNSTVASIEYDPAAGLQGGLWSGGLPFGLPGDQRPDEALSLVYTSALLRQPVTVCGNAVARLRASSSAPVAAFVAKLSDVAPDGASALVARGILNGTRRNGVVTPEPMVPGEEYGLDIELDCTSWRFEAGHRLRLAISGSDFPNSWPTPLTATLTVRDGAASQSRLELPVAASGGISSPAFRPPPARPATGATQSPHVWRVEEDVLGQTLTVTVGRGGRSPAPDGIWLQSSDGLSLTLNRRDPADVCAVGTHVAQLEHPEAGTIDVTARQEIRSDAEFFHWRVELDVRRDGKPFASRKWEERFKRELL